MAKQKFKYHNSNKSSWHLVTKVLGAFLCVVGLGLIGYFLYNEYIHPPEPPSPPPPVESSSEPELVSEPEPEPDREHYYPVGKFPITPEREAYVDGDLQIYIPKLALEVPVYNGVDEETVLIKGLGLFDQAQLPGADGRNSNVSIAAHRDVFNMEFYYIDTLAEGDRIYLTYGGDLYTYEYKETFVTDPYNWDPIRVRPESCITLQSCTPIMVASDRIFVVGILADVTPGGVFPLDTDPPNTGPPPSAPLDSTFPVI